MRLLAALPLLALTAAAPEPASLDSLAPDAETRWVPFDLTPADQMRFIVTIDGRPATAILDTGVSYSVLSRRFVDAAGMRVRPGTAAIAIGGAVASGWVDVRSVAFGALSRRGGRVTTATLPPAATGGTPVDMLVGRDITARFGLDIDYDAHRFRLLPSGRLPFQGSVAPLRIGGAWPGYLTEITIGSRRVPRMLVDTGDGSAITLTHAVWSALPEARGPTSTTIAYGIGGTSVVDLAIVPAVRSGSSTAKAVETRIERDGEYSAAIGMNGRIGAGFLARYRVLLDPGAGRMVLADGKHVDVPPLRSTSGLLLRADRDRLTVLHVMRGGPGEAGGWRVGDQICSVDGVTIDGTAALRWPVGAPGRKLQLGLCGGGTRALTLRQFY